MLTLTGCSTMTATGAIKEFYCGSPSQPGAYVPVRWSKEDTPDTVRATKANNAVYAAVC